MFYPAHWLRDLCKCKVCLHASKDKMHSPEDHPSIVDWNLNDGTYTVTFGDGHVSEFNSRDLLIKWTKPWDIYTELSTKGWTIIKTPATVEFLPEFMTTVGWIVHTIYGGVFDVKNRPGNKESLAYTQEALPLHSDIPFAKHAPEVQMLHCVVPSDQGGHTLLCDAKEIFSKLKAENPTLLDVLLNKKLTSVYEDEYRLFERSNPIFIESPFEVRFAEHMRAAISDPEVYTAMMEFKKYLIPVHHKLKAGDLLIWDNKRFLHGRTAFTGNRHLRGGYMYMDDFLASHKQIR